MKNQTASSSSPGLVMSTGHSADVTDLAFSPDSRILASAGQDRSIILWDVSSGKMTHKISGFKFIVDLAGFSPDGSLIACSDSEGVKLFDSHTGEHISNLNQFSDVWEFMPDGRLLVSRRRDNAPVIWDIGLHKIVHRFKPKVESIEAVGVSSDGRVIAIHSNEKIQLVDAVSGKTMLIIAEGETSIPYDISLILSTDINIIAVICHGMIINFTRAWSDALKNTSRMISIESAAVSTNYELAAAATNEGLVAIFQGDEIVAKFMAHRSWVRALAFSPDNTLLASAGDCMVKLWDPKTGTLVRQLGKYHPEVSDISFTPDGKGIISACSDRTLRVWNTSTESLEKTITGFNGPLDAVAVAPNGQTAAVNTRHCTPADGLLVVDLEANNIGPVFAHYAWMDGASAFSPDGRLLACQQADDGIGIWDVSSGRTERILPGNTPIAISPDGKWLAAGKQGKKWFSNPPIGFNLWDLSTGEIKHSITPTTYMSRYYNRAGEVTERITAIAFSHNSKMVAVGHDCFEATLWDMETGTFLRRFEWSDYSEEVCSLAFSPNDKTLAIGLTYEDDIQLWRVQSGKRKKILKGHTNSVTSLAYSPDGKILASGSADGTIKLWHAPSGRLLMTFAILPAEDGNTSTEWIAYTPEGYYNCSEYAKKYIRWQVDGKILGAEAYAGMYKRSRL